MSIVGLYGSHRRLLWKIAETFKTGYDTLPHGMHFFTMESTAEMALSEFTRRMVETKLSKYCRGKVPEHARHKVRVDFKIRGNNVTLFEARPTFHDPDFWVDISIAQFRYDDKHNLWKLFCADRNSRWHEYYEAEPTHNFEALLEEVDDDPTGIFWG